MFDFVSVVNFIIFNWFLNISLHFQASVISLLDFMTPMPHDNVSKVHAWELSVSLPENALSNRPGVITEVYF